VRRELIRHETNQQKDKNMALNIKPLGDRILVEPAEEKEVKKGGIIIPETAKEKRLEKVSCVGPPPLLHFVSMPFPQDYILWKWL